LMIPSTRSASYSSRVGAPATCIIANRPKVPSRNDSARAASTARSFSSDVTRIWIAWDFRRCEPSASLSSLGGRGGFCGVADLGLRLICTTNSPIPPHPSNPLIYFNYRLLKRLIGRGMHRHASACVFGEGRAWAGNRMRVWGNPCEFGQTHADGSI